MTHERRLATIPDLTPGLVSGGAYIKAWVLVVVTPYRV